VTQLNTLIEFFDQENIGLDTKIMLLQQLEVEILTEVRLGGGHFEIWLPTVVKYNFFSLNVKNIICSNILKSLVPHKRICSQRKILYQFY